MGAQTFELLLDYHESAELSAPQERPTESTKAAACEAREASAARQNAITLARSLFDRVIATNQCFSVAQLAIDGRDLVALGLNGSDVGRALETCLALVIESPEKNNRDVLLNMRF